MNRIEKYYLRQHRFGLRKKKAINKIIKIPLETVCLYKDSIHKKYTNCQRICHLFHSRNTMVMNHDQMSEWRGSGV